MFPPQKFEQREICEQPVQRETFLHSLDLPAQPWLRKLPTDREIPSQLSSYQHEVISPRLFFFFWRFVYVPMNKRTQNLFPYLWDNFEKKKKKKKCLVGSSFVLHCYHVRCIVDLDAREYTLGLVFFTSPYGILPASKLLTSYFWPPIVVNVFFHYYYYHLQLFQII